ncbi:MAG: DNA polymerase III subunit delta' [Pseudomonadota bacterium]
MAVDAPPPEADRRDGARHPRETLQLFGQEAAERTFLDAYAAGRLHHAWLLTGPAGVGKATLAWRIARMLLRAGDGELAPDDLSVPADDPVARRVAALSEPRLALCRRPWDEKAKRCRTAITVDEVRKLKSFFGLSAADGGWRVAIVDAADELNVSAANALLKLLEEPPERTLFLLVGHQPAALLPTIRSRCRMLRLGKLAPMDLAQALAAQEIEADTADPALAELADGSVGEAVRLVTTGGAALYARLTALLSGSGALDRQEMTAIANLAGGRAGGEEARQILHLIQILVARLARHGVSGTPQPEAAKGEASVLAALAPDARTGRLWAETAQAIGARAERALAVNLDPSQVILDTFVEIDATVARVLRQAA